MKTDIAMKELHLNIKHQDIQVKEFTKIGYQFDEKVYVFVLIFPFPFKKLFKNEKHRSS